MRCQPSTSVKRIMVRRTNIIQAGLKEQPDSSNFRVWRSAGLNQQGRQ